MIDEIDKKIIKELTKNSKIKYKDLVRSIGITAPTIQRKIKRMEKEGIIKGYTTLLDREKVKREIMAIVGIYTSPGTLEFSKQITKDFLKIKEINSVFYVTGEYNFCAIIICSSIKELNRILDKISSIQGVTRTVTSIVLDTAKEGLIIEL